MAWGSCYTPDYRVASVVGAAAGTTAANDRRLVEALVGTPTFVLDAIDTGRYALRMSFSSAATSISLAKMAATPRYSGALMRIRHAGSALAPVILVMNASTTAENVRLRLVGTGVGAPATLSYSFNNGSTWTASGTSLTNGVTYAIECFVDWNTGTTHTLKVRVNGTEVVNTTGGAAIVTGADTLFGSPGVFLNTSVDYADLATYNDTAEYGTIGSDWIVFGAEPTVDGTHSMTANDFQNEAATNLTNASTGTFAKVDDAPGAAPSTTDFVQQVVTRSTSYMEWVLRAMPSGYNDPVLVCLAAAMHPVAAATANTVAFRLNASGNLSTEAAIDTSIASNTLEYRKHHYNTRPGGAAWTTADVLTTPLRARFGYSSDAVPPPALDAIMAFILAPISTTVSTTRNLTDTLLSGTPSLGALQVTRALSDTLLSGTPSVSASKGKLASLTDTLVTPSDSIVRTLGYTRNLTDSILTPAGFVPGANDVMGTSFETEPTVGTIFTGGADAVVAFSTANPRTGLRHIRASLVASADSLINFPASLRQFTARFSIYMTALPTSTSRIFTVDGSNPVSRLSITSGGNLQSFIGGTGGTAVATLSINTLYVIDVALDMTTATYQWKVRVNGGTTQTQSLAGTSADVTDLDFWSTWVGTSTFDLDDLHITKQFSDYPLADMVGGAFDSIVATFQAGGTTFSRPITDTLLTPSDSIVRTLAAQRNLTDQLLTPSDSIVRTVAAPRGMTDTLVTPSDSIIATKAAPRTLTDTLVTPSDSIARTLVATRSITDTLLSGSPTLTATKAAPRPLTDTLITPSDSIVRTLAAPRPLTDQLLTPSDSIARTLVVTRSLTDTLLTFSPTLAAARSFSAPLTDTLLTPSDTIVRTLVAPRPITDTLLTFSPSVTAQRLVTRALTDTLLTPSDSIVRTLVASRPISDTLLTFAPSISVVKGPLRNITDTLLTFSPTVSIAVVLTRPLTDTLLTPSDSILRTLAAPRPLTDTLVTPSDAIVRTLAATRPISDTLLTFSPTLTVTKAITRAITDTLLTFSPSIATTTLRQVAITDTLLTFSPTLAIIVTRPLTDTLLAFSPSISVQRLVSRPITDTLLVFSPTVAIQLVVTRPLTDQLLTFTPSILVVKGPIRAVTDNLLVFSPTLAVTRVLTRPLTDQLLTFSPTVAITQVLTRTLTDSLLTFSPSLAVQFAFTRALATQLLTFSPSITVTTARNVPLTTQLLTPSDVIALHLVLQRGLTDALGPGSVGFANLAVTLVLMRTITTQLLTMTDSVSAILRQFIKATLLLAVYSRLSMTLQTQANPAMLVSETGHVEIGTSTRARPSMTITDDAKAELNVSSD